MPAVLSIRRFCWWLLSWGLLPSLVLLAPRPALAHPMPTSVVLLDLQAEGVAAELQLPLGELQLALGQGIDVAAHPATLVARLGPQLRAYLQAHVHPVSADGRPWAVAVRDLAVGRAEQTATGPYQELLVHLWLTPPAGASNRQFTFHYDVIMHQVVTHSALVSVRQDWDAGVAADHPVELGVIRLDPRDNSIAPLVVDQTGGSRWRGFKNMVALGLQHIAEGTDHLLFLLALLLPAPLLVRGGRWGSFGGVGYSLRRLLRVVTAFTVGHSLTLLVGALGWLRLPSQPVEILIAFSILVSAGHALRPLFPGREAWVAAGFGLVHGLAFASSLAGLHLDGSRLALTILGFNVGIELMQLFVIALVVPWLILLSRTPAYAAVRMGGALFAAVAAGAWMVERILGQANPLTALVAQVARFAPWLLLALAVVALASFWRERRQAGWR